MANSDAFQSGVDIGMGKKSTKKSSKGVGQVTTSAGQTLYPDAPLKSYHKGGRVKKTGPARLKKGELVMTVSQQKSAGLKKNGRKKSNARKRVASKR